MLDFANQHLEIGQTVVMNPPKYAGLAVGFIIHMTAQKVRIAYFHQGHLRSSLQYKEEVLVVNQPKLLQEGDKIRQRAIQEGEYIEHH